MPLPLAQEKNTKGDGVKAEGLATGGCEKRATFPGILWPGVPRVLARCGNATSIALLGI